MKLSTERILTTHTGSLPRPESLLAWLASMDQRAIEANAEFDAEARRAVADIVRRQVETGIDVVNDGEMGKVGYSTYVTDRLTGFEGESRPRPPHLEFTRFPEFYGTGGAGLTGRIASASAKTPACTGPIAWRGDDQVRRDLDRFREALAGTEPAEAFLTAASPGVVWYFLENQYYPSHEAYIEALAAALKHEYDAIHQAGFVLQVDCPDLAGGWNRPRFARADYDDFRKLVALHVEALNAALADIPPDRLRLHVCWGNYEGPHVRDVPIREILGEILRARPAAISFEGANPRHEWEWQVFEDVKLPAGKAIIPGVLDSTTNFVEHPELIAQRIVRYAQLVGRENVIAGTDCGFSTFAGPTKVHPTITWVKLGAMVEGARLASRQLWG